MIEVLYEDNHIVIVNKQSGQITQGDKTGDQPLSDYVKEYIKKKYNKPGNIFLGTVHRLDRPVSGVIMFAKTSKALTRLNKMFQEKKIQKTYWALVENLPVKSEDHLIHYLVKNPKNNKTTAFKKECKDGKKSELTYKHLSHPKYKNLIEVTPLTGRPHQIRVQLATVCKAITGDLKYGALKANTDKSICLHAKKIEFIHPVSKEKIKVEAPEPKKIWTACSK